MPQSSQSRFAALVREQLVLLGEDPYREGLRKTPVRVARMYEELLGGTAVDESALIRAIFDSEEYDQMIALTNIEFVSMCEHHMLPFVGVAHVAYIPKGKVLGVSKLARVVEMYSRRLQLQERLTSQVASFIMENVKPIGVGVIVRGQHMCMAIRGVKKTQAHMVTSAMLGKFRDDAKVRHEFQNLVHGS